MSRSDRPEPESEIKKKILTGIIKDEAIVISKHLITLSSGEKTHFYYDIKKILGYPTALDLIADLMLNEVRKFKGKSVGGLEIGAIPIATSIMMKAHANNTTVSSFIVRKKAKDHGMKNTIEGNLIHPVVIVDDVVTSGRSVKEAIEAVRDKGKSVRGVVAVIDREDKENILKKSRTRYVTLFKHTDFEEFIDAKLKNLRSNTSIRK